MGALVYVAAGALFGYGVAYLSGYIVDSECFHKLEDG